jgi:hypothetical protein
MAPQVRAQGEYRLWRTALDRKFIRDWQAMVLRLKAQSPEEGAERGRALMREFRAEQGLPEPDIAGALAADRKRRAREDAAAARSRMNHG